MIPLVPAQVQCQPMRAFPLPPLRIRRQTVADQPNHIPFPSPRSAVHDLSTSPPTHALPTPQHTHHSILAIRPPTTKPVQQSSFSSTRSVTHPRCRIPPAPKSSIPPVTSSRRNISCCHHWRHREILPTQPTPLDALVVLPLSRRDPSSPLTCLLQPLSSLPMLRSPSLAPEDRRGGSRGRQPSGVAGASF